MSQVSTSFHWQAHEDTAVINRSQDVEPILDQCAELRATGATGAGGDMHHAARIPMVCVEQYMSQAGINMQQFLTDPEHVRRMLADPALAAFRVHTGAVGGIRRATVPTFAGAPAWGQ